MAEGKAPGLGEVPQKLKHFCKYKYKISVCHEKISSKLAALRRRTVDQYAFIEQVLFE